MIFKSSIDGVKKSKEHYHIVLTPDIAEKIIPDDTNSVVGVAKDHQHPIEDMDPETGVITLGEVLNHSHTFNVTQRMAEAKLKPSEKSKDERKIVFEEKFKRAAENDSKSIENGAKAYKYIYQEQWPEDAKAILENADRAALMFDQIGPNTDKLIGHFLQDIPDPATYPIEKGDEIISDIVTVVLKHILRQSGRDQLAEAVFSDEFIAGRGIWEVVMDFTKDIGGDILVESTQYNQLLTGPHTKLDMSDCEDMFRVRYLSRNQGEMEFGEKFEDAISKAAYFPMAVLAETGYDYNTWYKTPGHMYDPPNGTELPKQLSDMDKARLIYPIVDWYRKVYFKEYIFKSQAGVNPPMRMTKNDAKQLRDAGVATADRISFTIEKTSMFSAEELDRLDTGFDTTPFQVTYGKKSPKGFQGKVHGAIDMQDEVNKRSSQMTEVVNKMAGYNWFFDGETFSKPGDKKKFLNQAAVAGSSFEVRDIANVPVKVEGVKFPGEILNLEQNALQRMDMYFGGVLNVEEASKMGSRGMMLQERTALKINEIYFKHYENGFKMLSKKLIAYVQRFYPPQKILRIIRSAPTTEKEMAYQQVRDAEIIRMLSETDLTKYDLAIDVVKSSPTFKEAQTEMLKEMMGQGAQIPLAYFVEQSSLPDKTGLLDMLNEQAQGQAEASKQANNAEVMKTLTAKLPEGSPIIPILMKQAGFDPQGIEQGTREGFEQNPPPQ